MSKMVVKTVRPVSKSCGGGVDGTAKSSFLMIVGRMLASDRKSAAERVTAAKMILEVILETVGNRMINFHF